MVAEIVNEPPYIHMVCGIRDCGMILGLCDFCLCLCLYFKPEMLAINLLQIQTPEDT